MVSSFFPGDPLSRQSLPIRGILRELFPAGFVVQGYYSLKKREYRKCFQNLAGVEKRLRLPEMFFAGGLAALLACRYLHGQDSPWRNRLVYARLFSLWANYLILADAASDQRELGAEASRDFLEQCLAAIFRPVVDANLLFQEVAAGLMARHPSIPWPLTNRAQDVAPSPLGRAALRLAHLFGKQAASCLVFHRDNKAAAGALGLFTERMLTLLQGQRASLEQDVFRCPTPMGVVPRRGPGRQIYQCTLGPIGFALHFGRTNKKAGGAGTWP